ncbi:hypothetical protein CAEBREN_21703 [Caenorhabditis brenneri]|uniref:G-protein coupled receptors family 1 profile domain-containing protein n=1 Tax=Caenorhabditis brenneri TaxID=135651 RepID=G0MUD0_CAEBE|nr:hypothetical protein CAEBREN_21703 [Caenorhabditis brenneri]
MLPFSCNSFFWTPWSAAAQIIFLDLTTPQQNLYVNLKLGWIKPYERQVGIISLLINLFHLIVLTRTSMRTSSINIIMSAIAFTDICSFLFKFYLMIIVFIEANFTCVETRLYGYVITENSLIIIVDWAKRVSTWLCFSIALIRTLVVRNPLDQFYSRLAEPKTAFYVIVGEFIGFLPLNVLKAFQFKIYEYEGYSKCDQNLRMMVLETRPVDFYQIDNAFYLKLYNAVDGLVSHLIPCILFPFITFLLVKELWKADENRKKLFSSNRAKDSKRTTRLVYYFTLTFFLAEFPYGICSSIAQLFYKSSGIMFILQFFGHLFSMLITANTSTHFIVCMLMSSQYREAAKSVICCGRRVGKVDAKACN